MFGLKKLKKRVNALIILVITGCISAGGYAGKDHPVMQQILAYLGANISKTPAVPGEAGAGSAILTAFIDKLDPFHKPGEFEVTIEKLHLDDAEYNSGSTIELHVRVVKYNAKNGKGVVVWDGREQGGRPHVAGKGPIVAGWHDKPFIVEWKEGDDFDVEIWNRKGLRATKKLVFESESDGSFPLRSKSHTFDVDASGKALRNPTENSIVFHAKRVAGGDAKSTEVVGEKPNSERSTRR